MRNHLPYRVVAHAKPPDAGLACLHRLRSHQPPASQPDLPACLATRVACTFQHGTCHILHSSPSLLPVALSAHMLPSPGKPSDSLPHPHLLNMPSHQPGFLCVPTALITRHHKCQFPSISCVIPEGRDCVLVLLIALARGSDMKRVLNKYLSDK